MQPHGLQHAGLPGPSLSPRVCSNLCSLCLSNHVILCRPLLLLPSIFPSIRVFSSEPALRIRWPKYWSFNFSISSSSDYSGWISFRIDILDLTFNSCRSLGGGSCDLLHFETRSLGPRGENLRADVTRGWDSNHGLTQSLLN